MFTDTSENGCQVADCCVVRSSEKAASAVEKDYALNCHYYVLLIQSVYSGLRNQPPAVGVGTRLEVLRCRSIRGGADFLPDEFAIRL